ncbi:hypothetical protein DMJ13_27570 [halophilic archaeon]|nr:hypothetical protein DMJ13_27570 [halophilic archaeon]
MRQLQRVIESKADDIMAPNQRKTTLFDALNKNSSSKLSEATVRELLADRQRRALLHYLEKHDDPVEIQTIIEALTYQEKNGRLKNTTAELYKQIATAVWETHLPMLAAHDIVRYDQDSGMVRWWRNAGQLTRYLRDLA